VTWLGTATHCNTPQHTATHCETHWDTLLQPVFYIVMHTQWLLLHINNSVLRVTWLIICRRAHSYWHEVFEEWVHSNKNAFFEKWPLILIGEMTHSYAWHESFLCVTWLIHMSFIWETWLIHLQYMWQDSLIRVTWRVTPTCHLYHMWDMTIPCVITYTTYVTWLIHLYNICDMTHSPIQHMWHDAFTYGIPDMPSDATWLIDTCDTTCLYQHVYLYVWHDVLHQRVTSILCETWLHHDSFTYIIWDMTHSPAWYVTKRIHLHFTWHDSLIRVL